MFISYSHDSVEHQREVLELAQLGATFEALLANQLLYEKRLDYERLVPVIFDGSSDELIPLAVRAAASHVLPGQYEQLRLRLDRARPSAPWRSRRDRYLVSDVRGKLQTWGRSVNLGSDIRHMGKSGCCSAPTTSGSTPATATARSTSGTYLLSASFDGTARVWPMTPPEMIRLACYTVGRNPTLAEWKSWLPDQPYEPVCD